MDRDRDRPCGSTQHPRKYRKKTAESEK